MPLFIFLLHCNKKVYNTIVWKRLWGNLGVNLITGEPMVLFFGRHDLPRNCAIYDNNRRCLICPHFYLRCHEETLGPFLTYEDALAEMQYRQDPLSLDYIPLRQWEIIQ